MRQYYASDKKRREEAKRKHQAEKRMKKQNKSQKPADQENVSASGLTSEESKAPAGTPPITSDSSQS